MSTPTPTQHRRAALALLALVARPDGGRAFVSILSPRPAAPAGTSLRATAPSVGVFFGTSTGGTEDAAYLVSAALGDVASDPIDIEEAAGSLADQFSRFDSLVCGTPTWNTGGQLHLHSPPQSRRLPRVVSLPSCLILAVCVTAVASCT